MIIPSPSSNRLVLTRGGGGGNVGRDDGITRDDGIPPVVLELDFIGEIDRGFDFIIKHAVNASVITIRTTPLVKIVTRYFVSPPPPSAEMQDVYKGLIWK